MKKMAMLIAVWVIVFLTAWLYKPGVKDCFSQPNSVKSEFFGSSGFGIGENRKQAYVYAVAESFGVAIVMAEKHAKEIFSGYSLKSAKVVDERQYVDKDGFHVEVIMTWEFVFK